MQARIRFLIPYFGQWPFWMPFFLQSCRFNPSINWLFFTDCGVPDDCPPNVHIRNIHFAEYCHLVSARLGIEFSPDDRYKLCDLKPALGFIHAEELEGYDFWAFGDIDLVYGNLRRHFSAERLERFDLLSSHFTRVSGHLCLLRNTAAMREAFKRVPDWREVLADSRHYAFDEKRFSRLFVKNKNWPEALRRLRRRFDPALRRSEFVEAFSTPFARIPWVDGSFDFPRQWWWQEGSLRTDRDGERDFPYLHFMIWKGREWAALDPAQRILPPGLASSATGWSISAEGFRPLPAADD